MSSLSGISNKVVDHLLQNPTFLLDGGTGEELFRRGVPDDRKIWSATAIVNSQYHGVLKQVHQAFIDAGSRAITTNSYGIVPGVGFEEDEISVHVECAGRLAREVVTESKGDVLVLGSLGPLIESYRADKILPHDQGVPFYRIMIDSLSKHVDCFLAETMSGYQECIQVVDSVRDHMPIMVSFSLDGRGRFRSGEVVCTGLRRLLTFSEKKNLIAILFNCSEPEAISIALQKLKGDSELTEMLNRRRILLGAYANRLTPIADDWSLEGSEEPQGMRDELAPCAYWDKFVSRWVKEQKVRLIGGCCGITPEHISYIRDKLQKEPI